MSTELDKAQQPAEPVAWMGIGGEVIPAMAKAAWNKRKGLDREANPGDYYTIPLYTHPPQAQQPAAGLTVEEVMAIYAEECRPPEVRAAVMSERFRARLTAALEAKTRTA